MKNKAKLSMLLLAFATMGVSGCSCSKDNSDNPDNPAEVDVIPDDNITQIKLNKRYASMFYSDKGSESFNEEITLTPTVLPKKAGRRGIKWSSSNPEVATVDKNGKVKAVGEGFAEITVSNVDGTASASTHICVNNVNGQKATYCITRQNDIFNKQRSSSFVVPDVVTTYETLTRTLTKNGVVVSKTDLIQTIKTSKEKAYLMLDNDRTEYRVEGGSPVPEKLQYVFTTTDSYETYLYKTTGLSKNYMSVNQSEYIGQEKLKALKSVCNNFFVSGEKIFTNNYDNILSDNTSGWIFTSSSGSEKNIYVARMESVPGQLAFDLEATYNYVADIDDENDDDIPYGTSYSMHLYDRLLYENNFCTGKYIEQSYNYQIGDDVYVDQYIVDYYYVGGEEVEMPNKDNYQKVDSISDL